MTASASGLRLLRVVALTLAVAGGAGCGAASDTASGTAVEPGGAEEWCSTVAMDLELPTTLVRGEEFTATQPPGPDWVRQQLSFVEPGSCRLVFTTEHNGRRLVVHEIPQGSYQSLSVMGPPGTLRGLVPEQIDAGEWLVCGDASCAGTIIE